MSFTTLGLSEVLAHSLTRLGYATATPVQAQSIPVVLTGRDLIARAQTGTGKTAAFGLPMLERLLVGRRPAPIARSPRALVLVPTRELALQVQRSLVTYGAPLKARVAVVIGGVAMRPQIEALRRGAELVVATPGRLLDHMQQHTVDLSRVEIVTLDEADRMLDMGFLPALRRVLAALPPARQTLLFSATVSGEVAQLAKTFTREPMHIDVSPAEAVAPTVVHGVQAVAGERKNEALTDLLRETPAGQALVFCKTKRRSDRVGRHLAQEGISAAVIHGDKSQSARTRALGDFKAGRVDVLVATDIAARGLDVAQLPLVVNYDLPLVAEDYVHRVGRTGRAGRPGRAVSLVSSEDRALLPAIQRLLAAPIDTLGQAPSVTSSARAMARPAGRRHPRRPRW